MKMNFTEESFSLLELVIAIAILAILTGGALEALHQGIIMSTRDSKSTIASNLAAEKIEEYSRAPLPPNGSNTEDYGTITGFSEFRRVVSVGDYLYAGQLKAINVTVYWDSDLNSRSLETLKADF